MLDRPVYVRATDSSYPEAKVRFYRQLYRLPHIVRPADIVIADTDFNGQLGYLVRRHLGGRVPVPADWTDNGDGLIQACSDQSRFLANTYFRHKGRNQLICGFPHPPIQIQLHSIGLRLTTLPWVTGEVDQSKIADLCCPCSWTQIII